MPLPRSVRLILCLGFAATIAGVGALAARGTWDAAAVVLALSIVALPGLAVLVAEQPAAALGVFVAGQVLEAFEYRTPAGTLSFGVIVLGLLLLFHWRSAWDAVRGHRDLIIAGALFAGWVASYALRLRYASVTSVAREVVTLLSFGAIAVGGLAVARRHRVISSVGIGATAALLFLGACGVLASLGAIPEPDRIGGPARELFGLSSPIERNYGLNVAFDTVALLVPLCVPWLLVAVASRSGRRRLLPAVALAAFLVTVIFVFQAREMVVQSVVAVVVTVLVVRPKVGWVVAVVGVPVLIAAVVALMGVDTTSSDVRIANTRFVVTVLKHDPQRLVLGTDENRFFAESVESSPGLVAALHLDDGRLDSSSYAIHNFFLSNLVAGGIVAFILSVLLFAVVIRRAWRLWRLAPRNQDTRTLLVACVVLLVTLLLEPLRANAAAQWILVGLVLGFALRSRKRLVAESPPDQGVLRIHDRRARASALLGIPLSRVLSSARRHRVAFALPLLLAPSTAVGLALAHPPAHSAIGDVTFTEQPFERAYFGDPPLVLRTDDVQRGAVALEVHNADRTTFVTVRARASRRRAAVQRVNAYLDEYVPWHEGVAIGRVTAARRFLHEQIARLREPRDAARREALAAQYDQLVRLAHLPVGRASTLDRATVSDSSGRSIGTAFAVALGLGLFLGLGAAVALHLLVVSHVVGKSAFYGGAASPAAHSPF